MGSIASPVSPHHVQFDPGYSPVQVAGTAVASSSEQDAARVLDVDQPTCMGHARDTEPKGTAASPARQPTPEPGSAQVAQDSPILERANEPVSPNGSSGTSPMGAARGISLTGDPSAPPFSVVQPVAHASPAHPMCTRWRDNT